jgi:hypothetical protein
MQGPIRPSVPAADGRPSGSSLQAVEEDGFNPKPTKTIIFNFQFSIMNLLKSSWLNIIMTVMQAAIAALTALGVTSCTAAMQ